MEAQWLAEVKATCDGRVTDELTLRRLRYVTPSRWGTVANHHGEFHNKLPTIMNGNSKANQIM
jgi:hypothetical protein